MPLKSLHRKLMAVMGGALAGVGAGQDDRAAVRERDGLCDSAQSVRSSPTRRKPPLK